MTSGDQVSPGLNRRLPSATCQSRITAAADAARGGWEALMNDMLALGLVVLCLGAAAYFLVKSL
jgi:hypothetical protein